ncbi:fimbrin-1 [Anaeramoeba ignava]|uniref:Fimbrin-1 n=1 Tax=Anaeramoeba ignava TaxID=1746090 RepID=A0A9Q0LMY4_ANAIG|nr:fimbrin-1 [Anaeramoeba ignava]
MSDEDENYDLEETIQELEEENRTLATIGLELSKRNVELEEEIEILQQQMRPQFISSQFEEIIDELKVALNEEKKRNEFLRRQVDNAAKIDHSYLIQLREKEAQIDNLQSRLRSEKRLISENENLKNQLDKLQSLRIDISLAQEKERELQKIIIQLQNEKQNAEQKNDSLSNRVYTLKEEIELLNKEIKNTREQQSKIKQLERRNKEMKRQGVWLEQLYIKNTNIKEFIEKILVFYQKKYTEEKNIDFFEKDTKNAIESLKNTLTKETKESTSIDVMFSGMGVKFGHEEEILLSTDEIFKHKLLYMTVILFIQIELDILQQQKDQLERKSNELSEEIEESQRSYSLLQKAKERTEELLKKQKEDFELRTKQNAETSELASHLENQISSLKSELENMKKREKEILNQIEEIKKKKQEMEQDYLQKIKEEQEKYQNLELEKQQAILSIREELQKQLENFNLKFDEEKKKFNEKIAEYEEIIEDLKQQMKSQEDEAQNHLFFKEQELKSLQESLNQKIEEMKKSKNDMEQEYLDKIEKIHQEYKIKIEELNQKLGDEQANSQKLNNLSDELKDKLEEQYQTIKNLEEENNSLKEKVESAIKAIEEEKGIREETEEENEKLEGVISDLRKEIEELKKQIEEALNVEPQIIIHEPDPIIPERDVDILEKELSEYINLRLKFDRDLISVLPIGTKSADLLQAAKSGVLLCKLINDSFPSTIDSRAINYEITDESALENHNLCVNSAKWIGCNVVGIESQSLLNGDESSILQLTWEIIKVGLFSQLTITKHPEILVLFDENNTGPTQKLVEEINKIPPENILLKWINYHIHKAGDKRNIQNFSGDLREPSAFAILMNQLSPQLCPLDEFTKETDIDIQAKEIEKFASSLGCKEFVSAQAIVSGRYEQLNIAFLALLFHTRSGLSISKEQAQKIAFDDRDRAGTREERAFRMWINSMGIEPKVYDLYHDLRDGLIILKVIDKIEPGLVNWKKVNLDPINVFKEVENCNYVIDLGKLLRLHLVNISGQNIHEGNRTLILGFIWQAMEYHIKAILTKLKVIRSGRITDRDMVGWANKKVESAGKQSKIISFKDRSLKTGIFLIDLVYSVSPKAVNYNFVQSGKSDEECMNNALYAISLCRKIGASIFVLPEDIVEVKPKMLLTVVGELMRIDKLIKSKMEQK